MLGTRPVGSGGPAPVFPCHQVMAGLVMAGLVAQCLPLLPLPEPHSSASGAQTFPLFRPVEPCPGSREKNDC